MLDCISCAFRRVGARADDPRRHIGDWATLRRVCLNIFALRFSKASNFISFSINRWRSFWAGVEVVARQRWQCVHLVPSDCCVTNYYWKLSIIHLSATQIRFRAPLKCRHQSFLIICAGLMTSLRWKMSERNRRAMVEHMRAYASHRCAAELYCDFFVFLGARQTRKSPSAYGSLSRRANSN